MLLGDTFPVGEADLNGDVLLRLTFDDTTNQAFASFKLPGMASFQNPFPPRETFQYFTDAGVDLTGLVVVEEHPLTTTTTTATTTTTTTLVPPGQQMKTGKLLLVKNPRASDPSKRKIVYKVKEQAGTNTVVGDPIANGAKLKIKLDDQHGLLRHARQRLVGDQYARFQV